MQDKAIEGAALSWLEETLSQLEWQIPLGATLDAGVDIVGQGPDGELVLVAMKRLRGANRIETLKGAAAMAVLELRQQSESAAKLVWLHVDRLGAQAVDKLGRYLAEVAPEVAWVVMDVHGGVRAYIPMFGIDVASDSGAPTGVARSHSVRLFGDLNAWMLKILLMHGAPTRVWTATREACRNPRNLAIAAGVSDATAHRFVKVMTDADYLRLGRGRMRLIRVESLLRSWRAFYQAQPPMLIEARPLFELDPEQWGKAVVGKRVALGGDFAAQHFDLRHATRARRTIWVEGAPEAALDALDLVPAEPGRGVVWVGRPRNSESCFRARVIQGDQAFVDPCELMLETSTDPVRGVEQSDYLLDRILAWQPTLERDDGD